MVSQMVVRAKTQKQQGKQGKQQIVGLRAGVGVAWRSCLRCILPGDLYFVFVVLLYSFVTRPSHLCPSQENFKKIFHKMFGHCTKKLLPIRLAQATVFFGA